MICIKFVLFKTLLCRRTGPIVVRVVSVSSRCTFLEITQVVLIKIFYLIIIVRDKSRELCELLSDATMLQNEREFAR